MSKKPISEHYNEERERMAAAGISWLSEMEAINSPYLQNILYGNLSSFPGVKDCEILMDRYRRKMLIFIEFNWSLRKFFKGRKRQLASDMLDQLQEFLPSFEFRITEDRRLFALGLKRAEEMLYGAKNATKPPDPVLSVDTSLKSDPAGVPAQDPAQGPASPAVPDPTKQSAD